MDMDNGHFLDDILGLEDEFYAEGYRLGTLDGTKAGFNEGSVFAIEKGFEKFQAIGKLYGKGIIWAKRLPNQPEIVKSSTVQPPHTSSGETGDSALSGDAKLGELEAHSMPAQDLPVLPSNPRLEKHIATFLWLVNPLTLSMENNEEAVADFDDRLKRAAAKAKIIERMLGEPSEHTAEPSAGASNIEDINSLPVHLTGSQQTRNSALVVQL